MTGTGADQPTCTPPPVTPNGAYSALEPPLPSRGQELWRPCETLLYETLLCLRVLNSLKPPLQQHYPPARPSLHFLERSGCGLGAVEAGFGGLGVEGWKMKHELTWIQRCLSPVSNHRLCMFEKAGPQGWEGGGGLGGLGGREGGGLKGQGLVWCCLMTRTLELHLLI